MYASGVDSKIVFLKKNEEDWQAACHDRGQSHDTKAMVLLNDNTLLSAGLSTDIAVYKLQSDGRFMERHTKTNEKLKVRKIRHITTVFTQHCFKFAKELKDKIVFLFQELKKVSLIQVENGKYQNLIEVELDDSVLVVNSGDAQRSSQLKLHYHGLLHSGRTKGVCDTARPESAKSGVSRVGASHDIQRQFSVLREQSERAGKSRPDNPRYLNVIRTQADFLIAKISMGHFGNGGKSHADRL